MQLYKNKYSIITIVLCNDQDNCVSVPIGLDDNDDDYKR